MPLSNPFEKPVSNPYEKPVSNPYEKPVSNPYEKPVSNPYEKPVSNPYEKPVSQSISFVSSRDKEKTLTLPVGKFPSKVKKGVKDYKIPVVLQQRVSPLCFLAERPFCTINEEMDEQWKIAHHYETSPSKRKGWKGGRHRIFQVDMEEIMTDLMSVDVSRYKEKRPSCFGDITFHLAVCIAYADYYQTCILVLNRKKQTYVVFGDKESTTKVFLEYEVGTNMFSLAEPPDLTSWLEMEDYRRPLKALTHYKKEELEKWVNKLLPMGSVRKNYSKQELHKMLQHYCWDIGSLESGPTQSLQIL
jgi:hypothetical protein